ncbi:MAG TPA: protein phosphatase 2C domain-containing protein [Polyangiaceae bacterium]|jgi:protein phosphatase|nr:protein phosphatase 2C domain-containing protein [Polyangiaceae bacterium]
MSSSSLTARSFGGSDVGRRRQANEDAYLCDDELGLWVVADGMGGHAAGEIASQEAVDTIYGMVKRAKRTPTTEGDADVALRASVRLLEGSVQAATYMIYAMSELDSRKSGMGTTISAMMVSAGFMITAQVGDSRIYQVRNETARQLTEDHTLINWQLKQGIITEEEARTSRHKNVITRAVGNRDYVQVDTSMVEFAEGDTYLLCSDGLHGYLKTEEIPSLINLGGEESVHRLIDLANNRGGKDNITAVIVQITV